jgi:hypothetical protein
VEKDYDKDRVGVPLMKKGASRKWYGGSEEELCGTHEIRL